MGNAANRSDTSGQPCVVGRVLELRVAPPRLELPPELHFTIVAKLSVITALFGEKFREVDVVWPIGGGKESSSRWGEAIPVTLPSDTASVVCIGLYAVPSSDLAQIQLLAEIALPPYSGLGGLAEEFARLDSSSASLELWLGLESAGGASPIRELLKDGIPSIQGRVVADLQLLRASYSPMMPSLCLSVRQQPLVSPERPLFAAVSSLPSAPPTPSITPIAASRRQVITLELQNAALTARMQQGAVISSIPRAIPSHVRHLQNLIRECEVLKRERDEKLSRLDFYKAAGIAFNESGGPELVTEMARCLERRRKLQASMSDRVRELEERLVRISGADGEASGGASASIQMQQRIIEAIERRDRQLRLWREAVLEGQSEHCLNPEVYRLVEQSSRYAGELEALRHELVPTQSERQKELRGSVEQMYEDLDELAQQREDARVRSESELRELRAERDAARDRLQDAIAVLQCIRAKAQAIRGALGASPLGHEGTEFRADDDESNESLETLRAGQMYLECELDQLREREAARKQTILELEEEQDALVERTRLIASQATPSPASYACRLHAEADELQLILAGTSESLEAKRSELAELVEQTKNCRQHAKNLHEADVVSEHALDDKVVKNPSTIRRGLAAKGPGADHVNCRRSPSQLSADLSRPVLSRG